MEDTNFVLPKFGASGFNSLPPANGFESVASVLCSLRDEIMALRTEVSELRQVSQRDLKALDDVGCVKQDVTEIKTLIHSNLAASTTSQHSSTYASVVQNEKSMNLEHFPNVNANSFEPGNRTEPRNASATVSVQPNRVQQVSQGGVLNSVRGRRTSETNFIRVGNSSRNVRNTSRRVNIVGTRESGRGSGSGSGLSGVQRIFDVFVGGCDLETSDDDIKTFCSSNEVNVKKCESIPTKSEWYTSFKVSVLLSDRDKLLNADFWPRGVFVRKIFRARQGT